MMTINYGPLIGYAGNPIDRSIKGIYSYGAVSFVRRNDGNCNFFVHDNVLRDEAAEKVRTLVRKLGMSEKFLNSSRTEVIRAYWDTEAPGSGGYTGPDLSHLFVPMEEIASPIPPRANTYRGENPYTQTGVMENAEGSERVDYNYGFSFMTKYDSAVHNAEIPSVNVVGSVYTRSDGSGYIDMDEAARKSANARQLVSDCPFDPKAYYQAFYADQRSAILEAVESGALVNELTTFLDHENFEYNALQGDLELRMEGFAVDASKFLAVCDDFFADEPDRQAVEDVISNAVGEAIEKVAEAYSRVYAQYLSNGVADVKDYALKEAFSSILSARTESYHELYSTGEISTRNTDRSVIYYMYDGISKGNVEDPYELSVETELGTIKYEDISRANEAIHIFEKLPTAPEESEALQVKSALNTETIGICVGIAQMKVRVLDNGSSVMSLVKSAISKRADDFIDRFVAAAAEKTSPELGYRNIVTQESIRRVAAMFENAEYGDMSANIQIIMRKLSNQYDERKYTELYQKGKTEFHINTKKDPDKRLILDQANEENFQHIRRLAFEKVQNYYLAAWNEWASTNVFINDAEKYLLSSNTHSIDMNV